MTTSPNHRRLKRALAAGEPARGAWCSIASAHVVELVAEAGPDFVVIDGQHGLIGWADMVDMLRALARTDVSPLVRISGNDAAEIGRALDAGADGVIVPMIDSADEARRAAAACRYPPDGERSFGPARSSLVVSGTPAEVNRVVTCVVLIESARGAQAASEICAMPGVDAVMVGTADLALDLGIEIGTDGPDLDAAVAAIGAAAARAGVAVMITSADAARLGTSSPGGLLLLLASDVTALRQGVRKQLGSDSGSRPY